MLLQNHKSVPFLRMSAACLKQFFHTQQYGRAEEREELWPNMIIKQNSIASVQKTATTRTALKLKPIFWDGQKVPAGPATTTFTIKTLLFLKSSTTQKWYERFLVQVVGDCKHPKQDQVEMKAIRMMEECSTSKKVRHANAFQGSVSNYRLLKLTEKENWKAWNQCPRFVKKIVFRYEKEASESE